MGTVITDWVSLESLILKDRANRKKIVSTNGVFDILHVGHVRYLQASRDKGDILIVAINSDTSVKRLKGSSRPFVQEDERAEIIAALACVDYVTIFHQDTPVEVLSVIKPDIHTKGGDYVIESMAENEIVCSFGGRVELVQFNAGKSSTNLIQRIQAGSIPGEKV